MEKRKNLADRLSGKSEFWAIDYARVLAAIGVMTIHCNPLSDVDPTAAYWLAQVAARLAVPFFFMVSGFFLAGKMSSKEKVKAYIKRTTRLYLVYTPLHLHLFVKSYGFNAADFARRFFWWAVTGSYGSYWG